MPKAKYNHIYQDLKRAIEAGDYNFQDLLPSENHLVEMYHCSRNTVRRALSVLSKEGYVQSMHGIGVRVIFQPVEPTIFTIGGIESFRETARRNQLNTRTEVVCFMELEADARIHKRSGFPIGAKLYYIQRLRYLDERPLILDVNMFLRDIVPGLNQAIAEQSIYDYIENELCINIVTSKRSITVEPITQIDEKYLELNGYNCLAVVSSQTFNSDGVMFEYTQSRHCPDYFCFQDTAIRQRSYN